MGYSPSRFGHPDLSTRIFRAPSLCAPRLPLSIKGIIFREQGDGPEVLLLRNERQGWELPGGRTEHDETPEACLVREFKEETGLEVDIGLCVGKGVLTIAPPHVPFITTVCSWQRGGIGRLFVEVNLNSARVA